MQLLSHMSKDELIKRIIRLEQWIRRESECSTPSCYRPILNEICVGCRCGREKKPE